MKIAVFGGSFNPLHVGHAMLADTIIQELHFDKVLFVPVCVPPHKEINGNVSARQRLEMVSLFCQSVSGGHFEAEPCEVERGGISYTVDTLSYLSQKYQGQLSQKLCFVMGEEVAAEFHKWKDSERISALADLIISPRYPDYASQWKNSFCNRPTGSYTGDFSVRFDGEHFPYPFIRLESPMLPVSSTEIRSRAACGKSFRYLVPQVIFEYIEKEGLYKTR